MSKVKKIEAAFKQELNNVIVEEAILGFIAFEKDSHDCIYVNKVGETLFELAHATQDETLNLEGLFTQDERAGVKCFQAEMTEFEGLYSDLLVNKYNGQQFIANIGVKHLKLEEVEVIALMIQDVTLQKKLQRDLVEKQAAIKSAYEELLMQNKQLKELDIAKNRFIALTTHELRTPLSAMIASSEVLKMGLFDTEDEMKEFIDMIYEQGHYLSALINDILDFAKIQAGKMDFYLGHKDAYSIVADIVESQMGVATNTNVSMSMRAQEGEDFKCYLDDVRFKQVITNMVSNAIKYNKANGTVEVWLEVKDGFVWTYVKDTGKGISEEGKAKVFDEFETLGKVATHHQGTGLGMPISKRLIEGMGGTIEFDSEEGVGTCFWVKVPVDQILEESMYRLRPEEGGDLAA
ncbi:MAG: HAMP domain-containing histidine kinase [Bdellovibrionales bacterium]|nr:HAMP domain-containing histidine kinase [Bdellovibrionales bacterium]